MHCYSAVSAGLWLHFIFIAIFHFRRFLSFTQISFKYHQKPIRTHKSHKPKLNSLEKRRRRQRRRKICDALLRFVKLCWDILIFTTFLHHIFEHIIFGVVPIGKRRKNKSEPQNVAERIFKKKKKMWIRIHLPQSKWVHSRTAEELFLFLQFSIPD